jgi:hypothetical protein
VPVDADADPVSDEVLDDLKQRLAIVQPDHPVASGDLAVPDDAVLAAVQPAQFEQEDLGQIALRRLDVGIDEAGNAALDGGVNHGHLFPVP